MSFTDAIKKVFSNYANFSGRARRSEYWNWTLFNLLVSAILGGVTGGITGVITSGGIDSTLVSGVSSGVSTVWAVATFIPSLAVCVRRLHDIGKSGWSYLVALIPLVGWIIVVVWFLKDSQKGANQYGDCEKYPSYPAGFDPTQNPYQQPNYYQPPQDNNYYAPQQPNNDNQ